jgi:predicted DNA-binding WGR domain protein
MFESGPKFWEIWIDGTTVFTRFGTTGSKGQTKLKEHGSADEAKSDLEKQMVEKIKKGFVAVGGDAGASAAPELDRKELQRLLKGLKSLDDPGVLVLADWLQTQNHPWGELIALQHSGKKVQKEVDALLALRGGAILGELALAKHTSFDWKNGFVRRAVLGSDANAKDIAAAIKHLLALPAAALVEAIAMNPYRATFPVWQDWGSSMEHIVDPWTDLDGLAKLVPARVTHVGFGGWPAPAASAYVRMPSFSKLSKAFPHLTKLELTGTVSEKPGTLSLKELVELEVRFSMADGPGLAALAGSKLPKLERLSVWLGGSANVCVDDVYPPDEWDEDNEDKSRYPDSFSAEDLEHMSDYGVEPDTGADDISGLLGASFPKLVHLGFPSSSFRAEVVTALAKSKLVKQAKTLDLSHCRFNDDAAKALVDAKKQLAHLESIDLSSCRFPDKQLKKVKSALPNATVTESRAGSEAKTEAPQFHFRYVATVE